MTARDEATMYLTDLENLPHNALGVVAHVLVQAAANALLTADRTGGAAAEWIATSRATLIATARERGVTDALPKGWSA